MLPADGENRAPTATDDTYTVIAGGDIQLLDVLCNDSDPDGDPLSIADVDAGSEAVAIDPSGAISFEPPLTLAGGGTTETVSFAYEVADGRGGTDRALVTVQVVESDVPIAPIAVDDIAGPFSRGQGVADRTCSPTTPIPTGASPTSPSRSDDPLLPDRRRRHPDDRRPAGHGPPRVHDHRRRRAGRRRPRSPSSSSTTSHRSSTRSPPRPSSRPPSTFRSPRQATDADDDALTFACCDGVSGGTVDVLESSTGVMNVRFTPDPGFVGVGSFSYLADDQNGHNVAGVVEITVRAARQHRADRHRRRPPRPRPAWRRRSRSTSSSTDPDLTVGDELSFEIDARRRAGRALGRHDGRDAADRRRRAHLRHRLHGDRLAPASSASAKVTVTVTEPNVPAPTAVADQARTTQGVGVVDPRARQRHRSARSRA